MGKLQPKHVAMSSFMRSSRVSSILRRSVSGRRAFSGALSQHQNTPDNDASTAFEFNAESKAKIEKILAKYPSNYRNSGCLPLLWVAQEQNDNFLTLAAMNKVAEVLDMPPIRVYETATFYTMYNRTKVGKYHIQLCGTTPCMLCGSEKISEAVTKFAGITEGQTSEDGLFTLNEVECLGACVNAPMIQVNNQKFYEHLTPESMTALMQAWKDGKETPHWNQNHVKTCEGPQGKTTLKNYDFDYKAGFRDLDQLHMDLKAEAAQNA